MLHINFTDEVTGHLSIIQLRLERLCPIARRGVSLAYLIVDAVPVGTNLVYFAFVNYTTLGYGDVTPVQDWQLLGPMTANELSAVIWVVDRCHLRGAAENNDAWLREWALE